MNLFAYITTIQNHCSACFKTLALFFFSSLRYYRSMQSAVLSQPFLSNIVDKRIDMLYDVCASYHSFFRSPVDQICGWFLSIYYFSHMVFFECEYCVRVFFGGSSELFVLPMYSHHTYTVICDAYTQQMHTNTYTNVSKSQMYALVYGIVVKC